MNVRDHTLLLTFPIPSEGDGKEIKSLTVNRPNVRHIADFILLIGGQEIANLLKDTVTGVDGEVTEKKLKEKLADDQMIEQLTGLITSEKFDDAFALLGRVLNIATKEAEQLSPEDIAKIFTECAPVFFPKLFSKTVSDGEA